MLKHRRFEKELCFYVKRIYKTLDDFVSDKDIEKWIHYHSENSVDELKDGTVEFMGWLPKSLIRKSDNIFDTELQKWLSFSTEVSENAVSETGSSILQ